MPPPAVESPSRTVPAQRSLTFLLAEFGAEFPELPSAAVALAFDRACRVAGSQGGNPALTAARTALLARDRLDALRARAGSARAR